MQLSIRRREFLRLAVAAIAASMSGSVIAASNVRYTYVDGVIPLLELLSREGLEADLLDVFRERIRLPYAEAYAAADPIGDGTWRQYLEAVRTNPDEIRAVSEKLPGELHRCWVRFSSDLPLDPAKVTIFLLPAPRDALGGAVRAYGQGRDMLVLGSDVMSLGLAEPLAFSVFVQHELAHLHHHQVNEEIREASASYFSGRPSSLARIVWLEGIAVHASGVLNPTAGARELFRSRTLPEHMRKHWGQVRDRFIGMHGSSEPAEIQKYVYDGDAAAGLPPRAGYYFGARLASELSKRGLSLRDLFLLRGPGLDEALVSAARLAGPEG